MQKYMLLIRNTGDNKAALSPEKHLEFVNKCKVYIENLKKEGKLIAAQPLIREGVIISGSNNAWKEIPFNENKEIQVGYYHILARDIEEAKIIAKGNPEFEYGTTACIEVRPIKMKEEGNKFVYPKAN
jgi:hypothetical protein